MPRVATKTKSTGAKARPRSKVKAVIAKSARAPSMSAAELRFIKLKRYGLSPQEANRLMKLFDATEDDILEAFPEHPVEPPHPVYNAEARVRALMHSKTKTKKKAAVQLPPPPPSPSKKTGCHR